MLANIRPNFHQQSVATVVVAEGAENAVDRNADGGKETSYGLTNFGFIAEVQDMWTEL